MNAFNSTEKWRFDRNAQLKAEKKFTSQKIAK